MTIKSAIEYLNQFDPKKATKESFHSPCSHRGDYSELAFIKSLEPSTVGNLIDLLHNAIGVTFYGYKGGEYLMHEHTDVFLVEDYSRVGEEINTYYLKYILDEN